MERPRIWRACLLWAVLVLPALTADPLGLNEPRAVWRQLAGLVVIAVAVALARRQPLVAFVSTAVLSLAAAPAMFTVSYGPALGTFALLLGLRGARVRPAVAVFGGVGLLGTARIALFGVDPAPEWVVLTGTLLFGCVFPWLGGRYWRQSRRLAEAGWSRAARLEGEQRLAEERARLRERARIAQDMHDSLGHELSLIALRAGALQVAADLPDHHRTAVADLRAAAADATDRLHRIIGVLREEDEPASLTPAGETVEQLIARAAESGLPVRWERPADATATHGTTPGDAAERVLYRVVRESLTNAARHAPGVQVRVGATRGVEGVVVTVTSGGGGPVVGGAAEAVSDEQGAVAGDVADVVGRGQQAVAGDAAVVMSDAPGLPGDRAVGVEKRARRSAGDGTAGGGVPVTAASDGGPGSTSAPTTPHTTPLPHSPTTPSSGTGLQSLRVAVAAVGGGFEAGPHGDGFRVRAYVPAQPFAPGPPPAPYAPFTRARRRVVVALAGALGAGVMLVGGAFVWYAYTETHSVLSPAAYAELRLGASAGDIARVLPERTVRDAPVDRAPGPPPPQSDCRYYRASGELLVSVDHFRLCFDNKARLVAKDVIPRAGLSQRPSTDEEFVR
ncbi:sensor histidine kinase [Streptomyces lanatus]|uniref:histidine kinase n=1 Tax=Streptomyces lanatus TaxID=66900 RepID=A0ABV1Y6B9_9ACTN|nr:histidine kinase [Streptomyces lanatus]GHH25874.1 hypothetical protein GCM10018780_78270 [Streptomyces lanatus]